ncbi:class I SAM-dependent methyltransferase [Pleomorphomonas oryzae]|uniref:class I SAM-dependent methyltransferase n=1 Tax=Pleomorphomonas oryzae TaxID=261934 RepID=UPI000425E1EF|nr:class I SAM-dependent methyltransferase [Pleomorphomonas oryzae]
MKSSRKWLAHELAAFAASLPPDSRVLDAGAGDQRYKGLFERHTYEAADFEQVDKPYAKSTYVCDLTAIPVPDATYDAIVFTQVMEHLREPGDVLREFHRIGKEGCRIFYSAPLCSDEHEVPYDFYRYTQFGVRYLLAKAGFEVLDLHGMEGFACTAAYHLKRMLNNIPRSPKALGGTRHAWIVVTLITVLRPLLRLLTRQLEASDSEFRYTKAGFPLNYIAIARKAGPA